MPAWLQEVFLGYGDPAGATNLPNCPKEVDFRDTFLDWEHLLEVFPDLVSSVRIGGNGCKLMNNR